MCLLLSMLPILSKDCCVCGKHVHSQTPIQKAIVKIPSAHKNCLKDRTFDENTLWRNMNDFVEPESVKEVTISLPEHDNLIDV